MVIDVVVLLSDLVRIPSVNPMGREVDGPEYFEHNVTDYLQSLFSELGWPWERQEFEPKRANILARIDGEIPPERGGPLIMFEAHQDTVAVEGMTIPPWNPELRDGRVYGRGACDVKGGMACMIAALSRLSAERPANMPTIVMACSVNEEYGSAGAMKITELWNNGESMVLPRAPDAIIVAEPTMLDVVVAHKGVVRWKCHTHGRACHSSQPELGDNAIYRMSAVVKALAAYSREVLPALGRHRLLGSPTLSVGTIAGGVSVNTIPDHCTIEVDRRVLPNEEPLAAYEQAVQYVTQHVDDATEVNHEPPYIAAGGLSDDANEQLSAMLRQAAQSCGSASRCVGVPYGTDAVAFSSVGIPAVVFGPGSIQQAHTADEWIAVEQLHQATQILYEFGKRGLSN